MSFTLADATIYFKDHPAFPLWNAADEDEKTRSLAFARRILERTKRDTLDAPSASAGSDDIREDRALFEQALWVLTNNPYRANTENTGVAWDLTDAEGESRTAVMAQLAPEARRWMGWDVFEFVRA